MATRSCNAANLRNYVLPYLRADSFEIQASQGENRERGGKGGKERINLVGLGDR